MSQIITLPDALRCYDDALLDWEKTFGYPVIGKSIAGSVHSTAARTADWSAIWASRRNNGIEKHLWTLVLSSLAIGGDGPAVEVTFPDSIFTWSGPFQGNLRSFFQSRLAHAALSQGKGRAPGLWKGKGFPPNRMRIRVPHR